MRFSWRPDIVPFKAAAAVLGTMLAIGADGPTRLFGGAPARAAALPSEVLRYMPGVRDGLRLEGSADSIHWPVFLTAAQAAHAAHFRLAYNSAISVLPDASELELDLNGHAVGHEAIDAPDGTKAVDFAIPAGILRPGFNAVSIAVHQRHRVDCSMAATYELWTRLVPEATGLVLAREDRAIDDVADLPAILPSADGRLSLHVLLTGRMDGNRLRQVIAATQMVAIATRAQQPMIDFERSSTSVEGLDLAIGTREDLRRMPEWSRIGVDVEGSAIVAAAPSGHPLLVVTGTTNRDIDVALAALQSRLQALAVAARAALGAHSLAPAPSEGASFALADIGIPSRSVSGSLFHQAIDMSLPLDALVADYGRGTLDLVGAYAAGLERTAQIRIDINGRNAGIVRLPRRSGGALSHDQLFLPLEDMRPGANRIDLIAELPRPGDDDCARGADTRFTLSDATRISLPPMARGLMLPDIGLAIAGAVPYDRGTPHLVVPSPDRPTMAAALSLSAREAVALGRQIPFAFSSRMPDVDDGSTIVVAAAQKLDPQLMRAIGLDPRVVEQAWHEAATSKGVGSPKWWLENPDAPAACRGSSLDVTASARRANGSAQNGLFVDGRGVSRPPLLDLVATETQGARDWLDARFRNMRLPTWSVDAPAHIPAAASIVLAQGMSPGSRSHVTTIVTAPTASGLFDSMACLFDPRVWPEARGRLAVLGGDGGVSSVEATSFTYVASGPSSLGNARLLAAHWFSLHPLAFAAVALLTALCLSGSTLWLVRNVGRSSS